MKSLSLFPKKYRLVALMSLLALVVFPGCSNSEERIVDAAEKRYAFVKVGMTKQELVAKLGEPVSKQDVRYRWETVAGLEMNASLEVRFDSAGKVASVARSRESHD